MLRKLIPIVFALVLAPSVAQAQCNGQFAASRVCGTGGSAGLPGPIPYPPASAIVVGTTTVTSGTSKGLLYNNAGVLGNTNAQASGLLVTDSSSNPSISTTLPNGLAMGTPASITLTNGTGLPIVAGTTGTLTETRGGTNQTTYTLGDTLYASAANTLSKLAGNITTTKQYLSQTGNGAVSAAPSWATIAGGDITGAAFTKTDDTNVTVTLGGTPATAVLRAMSITMGWTSQLSLTRGGTNASLTANNGGIVYSTASAFAILNGTATANQVLLSGSSTTPAWSTATYPATTTINQLLYSSAANVIAGLATANNGVVNTNGSGVPSVTATPTLGVNGGTGGQITFNGSTSGSGIIKVAAAAGSGIIFQLPSANGSNTNVLQTDGAGVTSWVAASAGGTVTSVSAGTGMSFTTITATGSVAIDKATSGNLESGASNKVLTADIIYDSEVTITFAASQTLDFNTFLNGRITATANTTSLTCSNIKPSQSGVITWVQDGTGSRTMVAGWCSQFRWANGSRGVLSTAASSVDALFYQCISTTVCYVSLGKAQAN